MNIETVKPRPLTRAEAATFVVSVSQASKLLGKSEWWIRELIKRGALDAVRNGGGLFTSMYSIEHYRPRKRGKPPATKAEARARVAHIRMTEQEFRIYETLGPDGVRRWLCAYGNTEAYEKLIARVPSAERAGGSAGAGPDLDRIPICDGGRMPSPYQTMQTQAGLMRTLDRRTPEELALHPPGWDKPFAPGYDAEGEIPGWVNPRDLAKELKGPKIDITGIGAEFVEEGERLAKSGPMPQVGEGESIEGLGPAPNMEDLEQFGETPDGHGENPGEHGEDDPFADS